VDPGVLVDDRLGARAVNESRGAILRYREPVVWSAALVGIPAWLAHLVFEAAMVPFTETHASWRWTLHAATAVTAIATIAGMLVCAELLRTANRTAPGDPDHDDASAATMTRFLGTLGLLVGVTNLALILLEGSYVIFVKRRG
jgi:hypothetical protein